MEILSCDVSRDGFQPPLLLWQPTLVMRRGGGQVIPVFHFSSPFHCSIPLNLDAHEILTKVVFLGFAQDWWIIINFGRPIKLATILLDYKILFFTCWFADIYRWLVYWLSILQLYNILLGFYHDYFNVYCRYWQKKVIWRGKVIYL